MQLWKHCILLLIDQMNSNKNECSPFVKNLFTAVDDTTLYFHAAYMLNHNHLPGQNHLNILYKSLNTLFQLLKSINL